MPETKNPGDRRNGAGAGLVVDEPAVGHGRAVGHLVEVHAGQIELDRCSVVAAQVATPIAVGDDVADRAVAAAAGATNGFVAKLRDAVEVPRRWSRAVSVSRAGAADPDDCESGERRRDDCFLHGDPVVVGELVSVWRVAGVVWFAQAERGSTWTVSSGHPQ